MDLKNTIKYLESCKEEENTKSLLKWLLELSRLRGDIRTGHLVEVKQLIICRGIQGSA